MDPKEIIEAINGVVGNPIAICATADYCIDGFTPSVVACPVTVEAISAVMSTAHQAGLSVIPWGGGTRIALGNIPERYDVTLDLTGLDQVIAHNPGDLTATVQAGIRVSTLQEVLAEHGQFLAVDPPLPEVATIGGTLAVGTSGPLKWHYGSVRDVVIGMRIVQADGIVTKSGGQVVKNVSGYDMTRLHVGGLGTLGVIAEVSFKLMPLPPKETTIIFSYCDSAMAMEAALHLFGSGVMPLSITVIDSWAENIVGPLDVNAHYLAVRLAGRPKTVERMTSETRKIATSHGKPRVDLLDYDKGSSLWRKVANFGWDSNTRPIVGVRVSVKPSLIAKFVETLRDREPSGARGTLISHPAHGTVQAAWYVDSCHDDDEAVSHILRFARQTVSSVDGNMIVEVCPSTAKVGLDVWGDVGRQLPVMRSLKEQFDPGFVLNPGRFVGNI